MPHEATVYEPTYTKTPEQTKAVELQQQADARKSYAQGFVESTRAYAKATGQPDPAVPVITNLNPSTAVRAGAAFVLTVTGNKFFPTSVVKWAGTAYPTTYVSSTVLTAQIPAQAIASAGTFQVTVETQGVASANSPFVVT